MYTNEEIRALRKALGKTQTEFAVMIGVSASAVISWENGTRHPTWKKMLRINELQQSLQRKPSKATA